MSNFFNLMEILDFEEAEFQCQLGESLGFTRQCYLCSHFTRHSIRLGDCDSTCICHDFNNKEDLVTHWCWKLFLGIEQREGRENNIFVSSLGIDEEKKELFAEYLIPVSPVTIFLLEPVDYPSFTKHFTGCEYSRINKLKF